MKMANRTITIVVDEEQAVNILKTLEKGNDQEIKDAGAAFSVCELLCDRLRKLLVKPNIIDLTE